MSDIKNRLQFLRCDELFKDFESVVDFREKWEYAHGWRQAEPMVFNYGTDGEIHTVLSVSGLDKGKTVFIDIDKINGDINSLNDKAKEIQDGVSGLSKVLSDYAAYCGIEGKEFSSDEKAIKDASSLTEAVNILAKEAKRVSDTISVKKEDSDTVSLVVDENGQIVSANVRIPESRYIGGSEYKNDIQSAKDGVFVNVELDYDKDNSAIKFTKNGQSKTIEIPKEDYVEKGYYDRKEESLVLVMHSGKKVSVDARELISEWDTESTDTIELSRDRVKYDDNDFRWKDIVKADVKIHPNTHDINNILKKDPSGMYVDGQAKNILFTEVDGSVVDLQTKVSNISCEVSGDKGNIIVKRRDGIYASVTFEYDKDNNKISFNNGGKTNEIVLTSFKGLSSTEYSKSKNALSVTLEYTNGKTVPLSIPLDFLTNWLTISNGESPIVLSYDENENIHAEVRINSSKDNLLEVVDGTLFVSNSANDIMLPDGTSVYNALTEIRSNNGELSSKIDEVAESVKSHQKRLNSQKQKIDKLTEELAKLTEELAKGDSETEKEIQSLSSRIGEIASSTSSLSNGLNSLSQTVSSLSTDLKAAEQKENSDMASLSSQILSIKDDVSSNAQKITEKASASDLSKLKESLSEYEKTSSVDSKISSLGSSIEKNTDKINSLSDKLDEKASKTALDKISSDIASVEKEVSSIKEEMSKLSKTIDDEVMNSIDVVSVALPNGDTAYNLTYNGKSCSMTPIIVPKMDKMSSVVTNVSYDQSTQKLTIEFSNGQSFQFSLKDLVDVYKAGDGLWQKDNTFSVHIDPTSEKYLSVSSTGVKLSGISDKFSEIAETINTLTSLANSNKDKITAILNDTSIRNFGDMVKYVDDVKKQLDLHVQSAESEIEKTKTELSYKIDTVSEKVDDVKTELENEISSLSATVDNKIDAANAKNAQSLHNLEDKLSNEINTKADAFDVFNRETDTTKSALRLDMKTNGDGQKILYGNVEISTLPDNALKNSNGALYVSNNAKDIVYKNTSVASELDLLEKQVYGIISGGTVVVKVVSDDEHNILHTGSDGGACFDGNLDYGTFQFP